MSNPVCCFFINIIFGAVNRQVLINHFFASPLFDSIFPLKFGGIFKKYEFFVTHLLLLLDIFNFMSKIIFSTRALRVLKPNFIVRG